MNKSSRINAIESCSNVFQITFGHMLLLGWFYFGFHYLPIPLFILSSLIFSLIHQRGVSEWIHESSHYNLIPGKKWNDLFTHCFLGFLFMNDIRTHRISHFEHHRLKHFLINEDTDTNFLIVNSRRELRRGFFEDLTGVSAFKMLLGRQKVNQGAQSRNYMLPAFALAHLCLFAVFTSLGRWDIHFIYYTSLVFLYPAINRIRTYGQHVEFKADETYAADTDASRTIKTSLLGRIFIHSSLMKYHYEHHKYPQLPFRRLSGLKLANHNDINQFASSHWQVMYKFYKGLPK